LGDRVDGSIVQVGDVRQDVQRDDQQHPARHGEWDFFSGFFSSAPAKPTLFQASIPFAMAAGVLLVVTLYVLANVAYLNVLPIDTISQTWTEGRPPSVPPPCSTCSVRGA